MANIVEGIIRYLATSGQYIFWTVIILVVITFFIWLIIKIREHKEYILLVKIYPTHSKLEYLEQKKDKYIERKKIIPYFVSGTYYFDPATGEYKVIIKDPKKIEIGPVPFKFFSPIDHKKYKYMLNLLKLSPNDYKPIEVKIDYEKLKEIHNVYDTEATYMALKTIEEITERFSKVSKLEKLLPYIAIGIVLIFVLIAIILIMKQQEKIVEGLQAVSSSLNEVAKNLLMATK
ncbi:MAG: hypothetical protein QXS37_06810 [Candidatus Aenigmatarchaeota archaeon]